MHPAYFHTVLDTALPADLGDTPWAVITADAPTGSVRSLAENEEADRRLATHLNELGARHWRVTGRSREGDHAEPGYGVAIPLSAAKSLGRLFAQKAVFWIQHGELWVADCSPCGAAVRIGALSPRLNTGPVAFAGRESLAAAFPQDRRRLASLLRFLGPAGTRAEAAAEFIRDADDSCFTLADWCLAAAEFQNRLELAGRTSLFSKKLGYLACCAESQLPIPPALRPTFPVAMASMWDAYGYED